MAWAKKRARSACQLEEKEKVPLKEARERERETHHRQIISCNGCGRSAVISKSSPSVPLVDTMAGSCVTVGGAEIPWEQDVDRVASCTERQEDIFVSLV